MPSTSQASTKAIAEKATGFLERPGGFARTMWVLVDTREEGMDVARECYRVHVGPETSRDIPEDHLPALMYASENMTGAAVLVMTPSAAQIQVAQTTMQGALGRLRRRLISGSEKAELERGWSHIYGGEVSFGTGTAESWLVDNQDKVLSGRTPDLVVVDNPRPDWGHLKTFFGPGCEVYVSSRTRRPPEDVEIAGSFA